MAALVFLHSLTPLVAQIVKMGLQCRIPGFKPLETGMANPLQYSCLENSMDRGGWRATVYVVTQSQALLNLARGDAHSIAVTQDL